MMMPGSQRVADINFHLRDMSLHHVTHAVLYGLLIELTTRTWTNA
jgi:hypothetical protein